MAQSMELPSTQRAIVANDKLDYCIRDNVPLPPVSDECVIIKTECIGLNPVDTKMVGPFVGEGAIYGTDSAGTVVALGAKVAAEGRLKLGDRVAGVSDGMEKLRPQSGCFAEYASIEAGMAFKMPDDMSFEVGASFGLRIATASMALFHSLGIDMDLLKNPAERPFDVLVYGGATSTGTMAIQLLKRCGLRVIATCSPRSQELVESFGADVCFDYNDPECGQKIRDFTGNALDYALDCITEPQTMKICYQALGRCGGKYAGLEPYSDASATRKAVEPDWVLVSWMRGLPISWPEPFNKETKGGSPEFAAKFFPYIHPLFSNGELREHPVSVEADGFEGLLDGVNMIRNKKIHGQKLVYKTHDRRAAPVSAAA